MTTMTRTCEQKERLLKAKVAIALYEELGRVPKDDEVENVFLLTRVIYKVVLGLHFQPKARKRSGRLALF